MSDGLSDVSGNTLLVHGRKMEANGLLNLPAILRSHGIKELRGKFKGLPAVVTGAGPSLTQAIPTLQREKGSYLLIATDRSLKPLMAAGLEPHITCTADMDQILVDLFSPPLPTGILLYDRDCYYKVPKAWPGKLMTYDTYYDAGIWSRTFTGVKGLLCKNLTVSHTALYVAATLGCSPIILAGVDFAYPVTNLHAEGVVEFAEERDIQQHQRWLEVPGNTVEKVRTNEVFAAAIIGMENGIEEMGARVINASPIGARIKGAEYLPIEQALAIHGKANDYDLNRHLEPPTFDASVFDTQTAHMMGRLENIIKLADQGLEVMGRMKRVDYKNKLELPKWRRLFMQAIRLRDEMMEDVAPQYLMQRVMHACSVKMIEVFKPVEHLPPTDLRRLVVDAARHTLYFWQERECAKLFVAGLDEARKEVLNGSTVCAGAH